MSAIFWILAGVVGARYYAKRQEQSRANSEANPQAPSSDSTAQATQNQTSAEAPSESAAPTPGWFKATRAERAVMASDLSKIAGDTVTEVSAAVLGALNDFTTRIGQHRERRRQNRLFCSSSSPSSAPPAISSSSSPLAAPPSQQMAMMSEKSGPLI